jgi:hypothetical protein
MFESQLVHEDHLVFVETNQKVFHSWRPIMF